MRQVNSQYWFVHNVHHPPVPLLSSSSFHHGDDHERKIDNVLFLQIF